MAERTFQYKTGLTVRGSSAAIAFLWTHWEVCDQLNNRAVQIHRLSETSWAGKAFGGSGEWHLVRSSFGVDRGDFEFLAFGRFLGTPFRGQVTTSYRRLDHLTLSYLGEGQISFTSRIAPLAWMIEVMGPRGGSYGNQVGARLVESITNRPIEVREQAGDTAWRTYQEFMAEEGAIRNGSSSPTRYFNRQATTLTAPAEKNEVATLHRKLVDLEKRISAITAEIDIKDYYSSLLVFATDPAMALVKNRTIVEHIAKIVFVKELKRPSGSTMLGQLIDLLAKESKNVPSNIIALMRTVAQLGAVGGHVEDVGSVRSSINACEFSVSKRQETKWTFCIGTAAQNAPKQAFRFIVIVQVIS